MTVHRGVVISRQYDIDDLYVILFNLTFSETGPLFRVIKLTLLIKCDVVSSCLLSFILCTSSTYRSSHNKKCDVLYIIHGGCYHPLSLYGNYHNIRDICNITYLVYVI